MSGSSRRSFLLAVPAAAATALVAAPLAAAAAPAQVTNPFQSPINVRFGDVTRNQNLPVLRVRYPTSVDLRVRYVSRDEDDPDGCATRYREETVEAEVPPGVAAVFVGDTRYELRQFHFHTPSEHQLEGRRAPLEQHLVHEGPNGQTLVLAIFLFGGGNGKSVQDQVLRNLPEECDDEAPVHGANLAAMMPRDLTTARYVGSLTTSPYTGDVAWQLLIAPSQVSDVDLQNFQCLFPEGDARDPQPLNGRTVELREQHP